MKCNLIWYRLLTAALATLNNWQRCLTFLQEKQLLKIEINPSVSVGKITRWLPLNPLTLVTAVRQAHRPQNLMNYLSVIIPTLNEELRIAATLKQIGAGVEIIVVDGGSTDKTREIAEQLGAKVIISPSKGRAFQMNIGAKIAKRDILLFLHGDTLLPQNYQEQIINTLSQSGIVAGAFELKIDGEKKNLRLVEKLVNWRSRCFSLPYGDQGIFLKASIFADLGGFPELPIMEDFELIQRLKKRGKIAIVSPPVITSARRWQKLGIGKTTLVNQLVIIGYYLKIPPHLLKSFYRLW